MKKLIILLLLTSSFNIEAQTVADFENLLIDPEGFLNGSDGAGGFQSGNLFFPNTYDSNYESWLGWAISNITDNTSPGFGNQFSAISGSGYNESTNYAISYSFGSTIIQLQDEAVGKEMAGMYVTNSTYAYLSMKDGDAFSKKFGGATGDDPDFFLLTIKGILDGTPSQDSINFYLADYRFDENSMDYLIDEWTYVDLSSLGNVDELEFQLSSSDNGQFGMNTPSYFCVDNLESTDGTTSVELFEEKPIKLYPNPTSSVIHIDGISGSFQYKIVDQTGRKVLSGDGIDKSVIDLGAINKGIYFIEFRNNEIKKTEIIKVE